MHIDLNDMPEPDFEKFDKGLNEVIARLGESQDMDLAELLVRMERAPAHIKPPVASLPTPGRTRISIRVPNDVLDACRKRAAILGIGYQRFINDALKEATK